MDQARNSIDVHELEVNGNTSRIFNAADTTCFNTADYFEFRCSTPYYYNPQTKL